MGDTYTPPDYQNNVIDAFTGVKTILHVPQIGHNDGLPSDYEEQVKAWIRTLWEKTIQN